jgi:hypothetical protein
MEYDTVYVILSTDSADGRLLVPKRLSIPAMAADLRFEQDGFNEVDNLIFALSPILIITV